MKELKEVGKHWRNPLYSFKYIIECEVKMSLKT